MRRTTFSTPTTSFPQRKMVLGPESLAVMRGLDPGGSGFIRRSDMLRALSELGTYVLTRNSVSRMILCTENHGYDAVSYSLYSLSNLTIRLTLTLPSPPITPHIQAIIKSLNPLCSAW
jgi:hypothetical protein